MAFRRCVSKSVLLDSALVGWRRSCFGATRLTCRGFHFGQRYAKSSSKVLDRLARRDVVFDEKLGVSLEVPEWTPPSCHGCGALLQSQFSDKSGYIAPEKLELLRRELAEVPSPAGFIPPRITCLRCHWLREYNKSMSVEVGEEDYRDVLKHVRTRRALVLWMVDLTDFPISLYAGMPELIGPHNPVLLIGNKLDLIKDKPTQLRDRIRECLVESWKASGFDDRVNLEAIYLISAETGIGVRALARTILVQWGDKGDIYLVGCANAGKSTLFNALRPLLCGIPLGAKQGATISNWPGTTLRLVSFPIFSKGKCERIRRQVTRTLARRVHEEFDIPGMPATNAGDTVRDELEGGGKSKSDDEKSPVCVHMESELEELFGMNTGKRKKFDEQVQGNEELHNIVKEKYNVMDDDSNLDPCLSVGDSTAGETAGGNNKKTSRQGKDDTFSYKSAEQTLLSELENELHSDGKAQAYLHDTPGLLNHAQVLSLSGRELG